MILLRNVNKIMSMHQLGNFLMPAGLSTIILARIYIAVKAFRSSLKDGLIWLLFGEAYFLVSSKRHEYSKPLIIWATGWFSLIIGLIIV